MSSLLLPIHSTYAERIYAGLKRFEYRKTKPKEEINHLVLYETSPKKEITGIAQVDKVLVDNPKSLYQQTRDFAGIGETSYSDYFSGQDTAVAFSLSGARRFTKPLRLEGLGIKNAPQSFCYLDAGLVCILLRKPTTSEWGKMETWIENFYRNLKI